jgi:CO dehydrogenase/acetyl-CoA synthase alpha subunit
MCCCCLPASKMLACYFVELATGSVCGVCFCVCTCTLSYCETVEPARSSVFVDMFPMHSACYTCCRADMAALSGPNKGHYINVATCCFVLGC